MISTMETANQWIDLLTGIITLFGGLFGGLLAGLWAYAKLIVEKGLLPPSKFDIGHRILGVRGDKQVLEIALLIENKGSSPLIVSDLRIDVRYASGTDVLDAKENPLYTEPTDPRFGSSKFPHSLLRRDLGFEGAILVGKKDETPAENGQHGRVEEERVVVLDKDGNVVEAKTETVSGSRPRKKGPRGFPLLRYKTFVLSGVEQTYSLVTALPCDASQALVFASFRYGMRPSKLQSAILSVARTAGLIQFPLEHITAPHTAQRAFDLTVSGDDD